MRSWPCGTGRFEYHVQRRKETGDIKVVFHIGSPKTGTTAIQRFLHKNRPRLRAQGVLYPHVPPRQAHHKLLSVPFSDKLPRGAPFGTDYAAAVAASHEAWKAVRQRVRKVRPDVVLMSSEFMLYATHVERLADFAGQYLGHDQPLDFIAYLRTPSDFYVSAMQQWFKASANLLPLDPPPVRAQLDRFSALGKVTVRKFDRAAFKGGSVITDICDQVGIDDSGLDHGFLQANVSLSAEGIILLQDYRRRHHAEREGVFTPDTRAFIEKIAAEEAAHPGLYTKPRLKADLARMMDRETRDLRALRRRYGVALASRRSGPWAWGARANRLGPFTEAGEVIEHDPDLVERLRRAVI